MEGMPDTIEAYQVNHLPIIKAYADKIGLVDVINDLVPTEIEVDPGTMVLGLILDTLSGRSPLYRFEEFFAHQDIPLLLGKPLPPQALNDDNVGRVLDRLYAVGTMKLLTACALRAGQVWGFDKQYVHFDTTSRSVYGAYLSPEDQEVPFTIGSPAFASPARVSTSGTKPAPSLGGLPLGASCPGMLAH
jgi:hypothetical protein